MKAFTRRAALLSVGAVTVLATALRRGAESDASQPRALGAHPLWLDASVNPVAGIKPELILEPELIAQWRRDLRERLRQHAGPVVALVRWDKAILLSGLSREEGWRTQTQHLGQGVFRVELLS